MLRLVANCALRYASRELKAGAEFDATDSDARVLKSVGKASDAVERPPVEPVGAQAGSSGLFERKDEKPEQDDKPNRRGGRYSRSDMRAKD